MTERVLEVSRKAAAVLAERGVENARLDAELLLAGVLGVRRLDLYLQHDRPLAAEELERYRAFVRRRLRREPVQYILGRAAFRQLELCVDSRVLIPRPETEVLVGAVLDWAAARPPGGAVLDVGTGSGAIALSLAGEGRFVRVVATDVSADALAVARGNAASTGLDARVELRCGALFEPVAGESFDVIVSNPPYVAESERAALQPEVREYEPDRALFGGGDGMDVVTALIRQAPSHLVPGGLLALEIGLGQDARVLAMVEETGVFSAARVIPDLAGRPRILLAERRSRSEHEGERTT